MDEATKQKYEAVLNALSDGALLAQERRICYRNPAAQALFAQAALPPAMEDLLQTQSAGSVSFSLGDQVYTVTMSALEEGVWMLLARRSHPVASMPNGLPLPASQLGDTYSDMLAELLLASQMLDSRLGRSEEASRSRDVLAVVDRSGHRMLRLSQNLSLFARLQAGKCVLPSRLEDFCAFFRATGQTAQDYLDEANYRLQIQTPEEPAVTCFDPGLCRRMIFHLISNAALASSRGSRINLRLSREGDHLFLQVEDWGRGIPEKQMPYVFQSYLQKDPPPGQRNGFGLGLALCREIAILHGGSLMLSSQEGKGTRVTVSLPIRTLDTTLLQDVVTPERGEGFSQGMIDLSDVLPSEVYR